MCRDIVFIKNEINKALLLKSEQDKLIFLEKYNLENTINYYI